MKNYFTTHKKRTKIIRIMKMQIEVDQSGKIELLSTDTIIACSNEIQYSIKIPKKIKQIIHYDYKTRIKQLKYKLFCVGVYYCIERFLTKSELVLIDIEYHGKNNLVKSILLSYIKKRYHDFDKKIIRFGHIGKNSNAHHLALETLRKDHKPNGILTGKQIWSLLR